MKDFEPGFPEWTELGQDGGLDPLGMHRPIEAPTALMLLRTVEAASEVPRAEMVKWEWFGAGTLEPDHDPATEHVQALWSLYQACDLTRLTYEIAGPSYCVC